MILAFAFIALGYPVLYWGAVNIKHWNRSVQTTDAAPMSLLFGVGSAQALRAADKLPIHPVPFPYTPPKPKTTDGAQPASSGGTSNGNGAQLSPNYPGGSGSTIPTPPIPGGGILA
jgi:hypothetical protein